MFLYPNGEITHFLKKWYSIKRGHCACVQIEIIPGPLSLYGPLQFLCDHYSSPKVEKKRRWRDPVVYVCSPDYILLWDLHPNCESCLGGVHAGLTLIPQAASQLCEWRPSRRFVLKVKWRWANCQDILMVEEPDIINCSFPDITDEDRCDKST